MTTRTLLTINYKNGNTLKELVNYLHYEKEKIAYTVDRQVHAVFQQPVEIPMENIDSFDLEKVECDGWKIPNNG